MTSLSDYCNLLGWSISEFSRKTNVDRNASRKAINGGIVSPRTAQKIALKLSEELQKTILPGEIEGLNYRRITRKRRRKEEIEAGS